MSAPAPRRCAIYTRKSSEEGLDQAFNSLHAQREACEAYVKSQRHEGWRALPAVYDDGGFSGGSMERPALKALLAEIAAGRIDVVVVYKVDRLTRSLSDFARIVELFDARGVSFVSVTQAFNTTTSMGRLTLNVLLSFAQFEREVTGERIRDKLAASKAKGMWMGGTPPLGYAAPNDPATRALVVAPEEAQTVRLVFSRYLELGSVHALYRDLAQSGVRSRLHTRRSGRIVGGQALNRGALFHLLRNRVYRGEIVHKGVAHPGRHAAIVDAEMFDAAQAMLDGHVPVRRKRAVRAASAPLKGKLFDAAGQPMSPTFTHRRGGVHRYYCSAPLQQGRRLNDPEALVRRIPAEPVEAFVRDRCRRLLRSLDAEWPDIGGLVLRVELQHEQVIVDLAAPALLPSGAELDRAIPRLTGRLAPDERLIPHADDPARLRLVAAIRLKRRGGRTSFVTPSGAAAPAYTPSPTLIAALRKAGRIAAEHHLTPRRGCDAAPGRPGSSYERKLVRLAFLAPDIQAAILCGAQPPDLSVERLINDELPLAWEDQRRRLGFTDA